MSTHGKTSPNRPQASSRLALTALVLSLASGALEAQYIPQPTAGTAPEIGLGSVRPKPQKPGYFTDETLAAGLCMTPGCVAVPSGSSQACGVFAGDFDGDLWPDLMVLGRGLVPDHLFINNTDGTFSDQAASWGIADTHLGGGGAVGDYDDDGDLDVFVTSRGDPASPAMGQNRLYRNNGDSTFTNVAVQAGVNQNSTVLPAGDGAAFGDFDLDGDLDLYVATWQWWPNMSMGNRLYRNEGNGTFTDITGPAGINQPFMGFSPIFADMNGDLYPELMVAGDFGLSKYFVNQGNGTFVEASKPSGAGKETNGMGQAVADLDSDGFLDWYVTSVYFSGTGKGNMLYMNDGDGTFTETSKTAGVFNGGYGWGTVALDFDHDGKLDLIETNGWTGHNSKMRVWRGLGDGNFVPHTTSGIKFKHEGRALVTLDYDRDGDLDLVIGANDMEKLRLYRSDAVEKNKRWLRVVFDTTQAPGLAPNGVGTRVRVSTGAEYMYRTLDAGCNYGGQSELALHFGLNDIRVLPEVQVRWADGSITTLTNVSSNQTLLISAP